MVQARRYVNAVCLWKSTPDENRKRFDAAVERFANLEDGHSATLDAPLAME